MGIYSKLEKPVVRTRIRRCETELAIDDDCNFLSITDCFRDPFQDFIITVLGIHGCEHVTIQPIYAFGTAHLEILLD